MDGLLDLWLMQRTYVIPLYPILLLLIDRYRKVAGEIQRCPV